MYFSYREIIQMAGTESSYYRRKPARERERERERTVEVVEAHGYRRAEIDPLISKVATTKGDGCLNGDRRELSSAGDRVIRICRVRRPSCGAGIFRSSGAILCRPARLSITSLDRPDPTTLSVPFRHNHSKARQPSNIPGFT